MTTTAIVPVSQIRNLPAEHREHAVTAYLAGARDRLAQALDATGPAEVAQIKAEIATVAEMTKQLNLSKECRDDATEMVRRAEYALGKAIRKGQEEGRIATRGLRETYAGPGFRVTKSNPDLVSPSEFLPTGQDRANTYALADATDEQVDAALIEAREEGNLSRANVVRKVKQQTTQTRTDRANEVERLAREGHTSKQIAARMGLHFGTVKQIASDYGIDIPADRVTSRRRRLDADRVLSGVAESVSTAAYSLQQIDPLDLDQESAQEWVDSLTESLTALRKATNSIKESLRVQV